MTTGAHDLISDGLDASPMDWVTERLTRPLDRANDEIRDDLARLVLGRVEMIWFGALCLLLVALSYCILADRGTGVTLLVALTVSIAYRIWAVTTASLDGATGDGLRSVFLSGLVFAATIGLVGAAGALSGAAAVAVLSGLVATGLACGAAFTNAGAPLFAKIQIVMILGPFAVAAAFSPDPGMLLVALQGPVWLAGIFMIVDRTHDLSARLIMAKRGSVYLAFHDDLTGLYNRAYLAEALKSLRGAGPKRAYLLYLDLDGFKEINDSHGHAAGDELLRSIAGRIRSVLRPQDVVGRIGGDEFLVVLKDLAPAEVERVAQRLIDVARDPFCIGGTMSRIGLSIGGAPIDAEGDPNLAIARADAMLYAAKREGKGRSKLATA